MFQKCALKKKFELEEDDATGDWRKVYKKKLQNLNSSPNIIQIAKCR